MIADFETSVRNANRRFAQQYISVDQDWLAGCVEWFLSDTPQISNEDLHRNAYEQWLLSDLFESGINCLPQSVQTNKNAFEFTGNYVLQMQYLIDIAESAYDQYRSIHDKKLDEAEEAETEPRQRNVTKRRRTLKLELTDGHNTVIAMEHCHIPCLNTKLIPGTKTLVKGSMRCVNKVLFLRPGNVQLLGGEVEKLSIENAYENVLLKAMGRPITPTPKLDYQEAAVTDQYKPITNLPPAPPPVTQHNPQATRIIMQDDDDDLFSNLDMDSLSTNNVAAMNQSTYVQQNQDTNVKQLLDDDDDIFLDANIPDASVTEPSNDNFKSNHNAFDDDGDFDAAEVEANIPLDIQNAERRHVTSDTNSASSLKSTIKATQNPLQFDSDFDEAFDFGGLEDVAEPTSNDISNRNYEFKIAGCPLVTILQLHSIDESDKSERSFVVKCEIFETVKRLQIVSNRYEIVVLIKDSTSLQLEVKVNNDVIAAWADTTADELERMRKTIGKRPQQRQHMENILHKLSVTMAEFEGFMRIEYSHQNQIPEVTEIIDGNAEFEEILRKKLAKES